MVFTEDGLSKLQEALEGHVARNSVPGLVALVSRGVEKAVAGLPGFGMPNPKSAITPDQLMQRLGALPLMAQPGEQWLYSAGSIARSAYGWDGGFGTSWLNDLPNGLTAILLTQRVFDSPDPPQIHKDFWKAAYAA
jgi:CubicO group peptidase (beta-lactamase class C family)